MQRSLLLIVLGAVFGVAGASGQAIEPPPFPTGADFGPAQLFPSAAGWLSLNQYPQNLADQPFRWIFDTAVTIPIVRTPGFVLGGSSRLIFRFSPEGRNETMFVAQDLITSLMLSGSIALGNFDLGAAYAHDCRHGVDNSSGRLIIQDSLHLSLAHKPIVITWGSSGAYSSIRPEADVMIALPDLFQSGPAEPDQLRVAARLHINAVKLAGSAWLFIEGGAACTLRSRDTPVPVSNPLNLDWHARMGVHAPSAGHGASLYAQIERITDPWTTLTAAPVTLFSIGLTLASVGS